jgi:hypothetical protein
MKKRKRRPKAEYKKAETDAKSEEMVATEGEGDGKLE